MIWVRSMTFRSRIFSRLRSCEGVRSWSKITRSAPAARASVRTSCTLPRPSSVAGSGSGERCEAVPTTRAPALAASSFSSRKGSSSSAMPTVTPSRRVDSQPAKNAFSKTCKRRMLLSLRCPRSGRRGRSTGQHDCGDSVLENHLFLMVAFQNDGVLVKTANTSCQLNPTQQVNRHQEFFLAGGIQKTVLNVLRLLIHGFYLSFCTSIFQCCPDVKITVPVKPPAKQAPLPPQ